MLQNILNSKTSTLEGQGRRNAVKDSGNYKKLKTTYTTSMAMIWLSETFLSDFW